MSDKRIDSLMRHAGLAPEVAETGTRGTYVGMLRPFEHLDVGLMNSVRQTAEEVAAHDLTSDERFRAALALIELVSITRAWALDPDSMLTRNKLLSAEQRKALFTWVRQIDELAKRVIEQGATAPTNPNNPNNPHRG